MVCNYNFLSSSGELHIFFLPLKDADALQMTSEKELYKEIKLISWKSCVDVMLRCR